MAESHLKEALSSVAPTDEERRENPLNLHVSLALTYDVWARFEQGLGDMDGAQRLVELAQQEYQRAQALDPDNTHVLENYSRFKLRQARDATDETTRLVLLVDAISLLEWELVVDEQKRREAAALEVLSTAFVLYGTHFEFARCSAHVGVLRFCLEVIIMA